MKVPRIVIFAAAALMVAEAVGLAVPASADLLDGTYKETFTDGPAAGNPVTVVITSCGGGCKHAQYPGAEFPPRDFHLDGNTWTAEIPDSHVMIAIDNGTLASSTAVPMGDSRFVNRSQLVKVG